MQLSSRLSDATVSTLSSVLPVGFEMQVILECTVFVFFRRVFSRFREKLRKVTISFVMSLCPSLVVRPPDPIRMDFHKILFQYFFEKSLEY